MPEDLNGLKGDLSMLRDFLFFWIFLPILILILLTKLLVQILFFTGSMYCREIYEHVRAQLANSKAWCIGWSIAEEELRDAVAPVQTLAELFMTERYA